MVHTEYEAIHRFVQQELFESGQLHEEAAVVQYRLNGERVVELEAQVSACFKTREHRAALACTQAYYTPPNPKFPALLEIPSLAIVTAAAYVNDRKVFSNRYI